MAVAIRSLCKASRTGDVSTVDRIITVFPDALNEKNKDGRTPLIVAVRHSQAEVVKYFLDVGADVNRVSNRSGASPIWHSSWKGDAPIVSLLLENGADPTREAQDCGTPLMVVSVGGPCLIMSF